MKVYVVTSGAYSDYCIEAVFTDRRKADAYCAAHNTPDSWTWTAFQVEEYEAMDDNVESAEEIVYRFYVSQPELKHPFIYDPVPMTRASAEWDESKAYKRDSMYDSAFPHHLHFVYLSEPNKEKARKIVQDRYAQWKAERAGI